MSEPTIRPATESDIPSLEAVHRANDEPAAGAPRLPPGAQAPYFRHLLALGEILVAEAGDGGVVGFGAVVDSGWATHLADLFMLPGSKGGGIGRRLVDRLFGDRWPRTTFASDDPRAMRLYVAAGMRPYWPNLYLLGDARRLPAADGLGVDDAGPDELAEIEERWTGADRSRHHAIWARRVGDRPVIVRRIADGEPLATGHSRPRIRGNGRWLERLAVAPDADPVGPITAALADGAGGDGAIGACIPGPNPVLAVLLDAGFRIADRDIAMASDPRLFDANSLYDTGIP